MALAKRVREDLCLSLISSANLVWALQNQMLSFAFSLPLGLEVRMACRRSPGSEVVEQTGDGQFYNWILRGFF